MTRVKPILPNTNLIQLTYHFILNFMSFQLRIIFISLIVTPLEIPIVSICSRVNLLFTYLAEAAALSLEVKFGRL